MSNEMLTVGEAARRLHVSIPTLHDWIIRYGLPVTRTPKGGHRRFSVDDIEHLRAALARGLSSAEAVEEIKRAKPIVTCCPHCGKQIDRVAMRFEDPQGPG